jgi:hypothetical protein
VRSTSSDAGACGTRCSARSWPSASRRSCCAGSTSGVDFTGGTLLEFPTASTAAPVDVEAVRTVVERAVGVEPTVQITGSGATQAAQIRTETLDPAQLVAVKQALFDTFQPVGASGAPAIEAISDRAVSGSWGGQITRQALIALGVFLVLVTIFLTSTSSGPWRSPRSWRWRTTSWSPRASTPWSASRSRRPP